MKIFTISFFCALFIISCQPNTPEEQYSPSCSVSDSLVIAKIPITSQKIYKYFKDSTRHNAMEFGCIISLDRYEFGFLLFKFGVKEKNGSIEELFATGQASIWKTEG